MLPPNVAGWSRLGWDVLFAERQEAVLEGLLQGRDADVWAIQGEYSSLHIFPQPNIHLTLISVVDVGYAFVARGSLRPRAT